MRTDAVGLLTDFPQGASFTHDLSCEVHCVLMQLAVASELRKLGASVEERPDGMTIAPGWSGEPAEIETHGDHRIAMAFAIAGLARGNVSITREEVVRKSYPRFWRDLESLTG